MNDLFNFTSSSDIGLKIQNIKAYYTYKCGYCDSNLRDEYHRKCHIMEIH